MSTSWTIDVERYRRDGFLIVPGVFSPIEIAAIGRACDQLHDEGVRHGRSFRHGNLFYNVAPGPIVRMVQWPSYHQRMMNDVRLDPRMAAILAPLIGGDLKQIINQVHWKQPGSRGDFAWHKIHASAGRRAPIASSADPMSKPASRSTRIRPSRARCASFRAVIDAATSSSTARRRCWGRQ